MITLLFIIYSAPTFFSLLFRKEFQIPMNYVYLGVLMCLTQLFNSVYSININSQYSLNAGDISYSALLFTAVFLIISQPKPKVTRIFIYISIIISIFLFTMFLMVQTVLKSPNVDNILALTPVFFEFSYKSMFFSMFLLIGEILFQILILKTIVGKIQNPILMAFSVSLLYSITLIIDGILYPLGINIFF